MAFASDGTRVLLFGGITTDPSPQATNDTWELVGDEWDELSPGTVPNTRYGAKMIWDGSRFLMMGGSSFSGTPRHETWEYVAADWNQLTITQNWNDVPIFRDTHYGHEMVWADTRVLAFVPNNLFGGGIGSRVYEFTTGAWNLLSLTPEFGAEASAVPSRIWTGGCWNDIDSELLVSAGCDVGLTSSRNDILAMDGTGWAEKVSNDYSAGAFPIRDRHQAVWTGDSMFIFDGHWTDTSGSASGDAHSQYVYDPSDDSVTQVVTVDAPSVRNFYGMAWDGTRVVLFGGEVGTTGTLLGDTWVLEPPPDPPPTIDSASIRATVGLAP